MQNLSVSFTPDQAVVASTFKYVRQAYTRPMDRIVQFAPALLAVFAVASGYFASSATIPYIKTYSLAVYIGTILAVAVPGLSLWNR